MSTSIEKHGLSKSTFLRGSTCTKSLWLYKHKRNLIPPTSAGQPFIYDQGYEVGKLAWRLFPGGIDASPPTHFNYQPSIELTQKLIAEGQQVIYEAAFQFEGVLAALDILVKKDDGWYGYEVKSSTSVKDINVTDAALQYWVMAGSGIELKNISIVHLDTDYERHGEIEVEKLFKTESVLYLVQALQDEITEQVAELKKVVERKTVPKVLIGRQCSNPYTCDFKDHCWKEVPEESILDFTYYRKTEERFQLYHSGTKRIVDVEDWQALKSPYNNVVEMHIKRGVYIDPDNLKPFMDTLQFPLRFMDFETVSFALPPFDRSGPYDQMSFQYSVHTMDNQGGELLHSAFLADPSKDFREDFIKSLLDDLGDTGSITVWNIGFERSKLNALAMLYPQYEGRINAVIARLIDLAIPFQKKWVYHYSLSCSYSIKNVLPFVAPNLSYKDMAVNNGQAASLLFQQMMTEPNRDWSVEREHLLKYCELDTWAMVVIYRCLNTLV
jgi:hypothetical protein